MDTRAKNRSLYATPSPATSSEKREDDVEGEDGRWGWVGGEEWMRK